MEDVLNNNKICPYCSQSIERELYDDHILCHQIENEDNLNSNNNINPIHNNNNNSYHEQNQNQNNIFDNFPLNFNNLLNNNNRNNNNNQDSNILSKVFDLFSQPNQNENNAQIGTNPPNLNNNNNNNNINNPGFFNSLIGRNPYRDNDRLDLNNNNSNNNPQDGNFLYNITNTLSNLTSAMNGVRNIGNQLNSISSNLNSISNSLLRTNTLNSPNNNRLNREDQNNNLRHVNTNPRINFPLPFYNIQRNSHRIRIGPNNPNSHNEINYDYGNNNRRNRNNNRINQNEVNRIIQYLPSTVLTERKAGENSECIVCLENFDAGDKITTLPCVHIFHTECIESWLKTNNHCPMCQFEITLNSIMRET